MRILPSLIHSFNYLEYLRYKMVIYRLLYIFMDQNWSEFSTSLFPVAYNFNAFALCKRVFLLNGPRATIHNWPTRI